MKHHFISGLPRSGSTLLAAILRQNPKFDAGMTSPLLNLFTRIIPEMTGSREFGQRFTQGARIRILRGIAERYSCSVWKFEEESFEETVFDTNRMWTTKTELIKELFPSAKILCCVRDPAQIINSFEKLFRRNQMHSPAMFNGRVAATVYERAEIMMEPTGVIGLPFRALREAWCAGADLKLIRYDALVTAPRLVMQDIYTWIREPEFAHNFNNVVFQEPVGYDYSVGMPGLHKVRPIVEPTIEAPIIPPDLIKKYSGLDFWEGTR